LLMRSIVRLSEALIFKNRPIYVHYGITHRCNLRCRMCNIDKSLNKGGELSIDEIDRLFDILRSVGVLYVSIGGGEPFLREDLAAVIKLLRKKGFWVRLLTNATLADAESIKGLASAGLREISISLDTLDNCRLSHIYNFEGALEKIISSAELFSSNLTKSDRVLLINTVVSRLNIRELPQLCRFVKEIGYYISFIPVETREDSEFAFRQEDFKDIDETYNYLLSMKRSGRSAIFNSSLFLEKSQQYLKTGRRNWRCDAGSLYLSVGPEGEVSICHKFRPFSSLLGNDFMEHLKSGDFRRSAESKINSCSGCMRPCWAELSFLFRDARSFREMARVKLAKSL